MAAPAGQKIASLIMGISIRLEIKPGEGSVIIVDDVLATGGTLQAVNDMSLLAGYSILDNIVLIDLDYVPKVNWYSTNTRSLIKYESVR